jgi:hypothetical protein
VEVCRSVVSVFEVVLGIFGKSFETGKNSKSGKQLKWG